MALPRYFLKLIQQIQLTEREATALRRHAKTIRQRLNKEFTLRKIPPIGSFARGTALRNHSDIDLLALFGRNVARRGQNYISSSRFIENIRNALDARYTETRIRRDQQAVVCEFAGGTENVDVVPAVFFKPATRGHPIYLIPDGHGNWIETNPEQHTAYLRKENERSGGKLRRTAQLLKFWRHCRTPKLPIFSFYIELLLATEKLCVGAKTYPDCVIEGLRAIHDRNALPVNDPIGLSGAVPSVKTEAQRDELMRVVKYSLDHALHGYFAWRNNDLRESIRQWNLVFNGGFPHRP